MRNFIAHCSKGGNSVFKSCFWSGPKQFGRVQNGFEPTEGQGIRDAGVDKIESIKY